MKTFLLSLMALVLMGAAAHATANDPAVQKAEDYLRGLSTAKADFIQRSTLGGMLTGTFYLDRPGRLRFEYNEVKDFIVADGYFIYFYDSELGEQTNAPIGQTLADFLLRSDLKLSGDLRVNDVYSKDGFSYLTFTQTDDPDAGSVQLVFSEIPYQLRKWIVTDAQGAITEIELKNMERDMDLKDSLFAYFDPKPRRVNQ
jgi:outer membrane lipoprotein-sorting protein